MLIDRTLSFASRTSRRAFSFSKAKRLAQAALRHEFCRVECYDLIQQHMLFAGDTWLSTRDKMPGFFWLGHIDDREGYAVLGSEQSEYL